MPETVDEETAVAYDVAAMNRRFGELQRKAIQGALDASSAREAVLESLLRNMN